MHLLGTDRLGPRPVVAAHARDPDLHDHRPGGGDAQRRAGRGAGRRLRLLRRHGRPGDPAAHRAAPVAPDHPDLARADRRPAPGLVADPVFFAITVILSLVGLDRRSGREVRGRFLALREEDFVLAAELAGCGRPRIIIRHMVPTFLSHIIATSTLAIPAMIINETSLSFLGLGIRPPAISWGVLLQEAQNIQTLALAPWLLIPGAGGDPRRPGLQPRSATACATPPTPTATDGSGLDSEQFDAPRPAAKCMEVKACRCSPSAICACRFFMEEGVVRAVDGAELRRLPGQVLGIVGESGCGKSRRDAGGPPARGAAGARSSSGQIVFRPGGRPAVVDLASSRPRGAAMRAIRGAEIALIPQEPMAAFSPVHTVGDQIVEAIQLHWRPVAPDGPPLTRAEARRDHRRSVPGRRASRCRQQRLDAYSWQLSGGLRQRAMIAMALSCKPRLLIADEPTTAIDVTTQAQVLNLMRELQRKYRTAVIFITHDLGVIAQIARDVVVMYLGRVMEQGPVDAIFHEAKHPYTRALLRSIPEPPRRRRARRPADHHRLAPAPVQPAAAAARSTRDAGTSCAGVCDAARAAPPARRRRTQQASCFLYHDAEARRDRAAASAPRRPTRRPAARGPAPAEVLPDPEGLRPARGRPRSAPSTT